MAVLDRRQPSRKYKHINRILNITMRIKYKIKNVLRRLVNPPLKTTDSSAKEEHIYLPAN